MRGLQGCNMLSLISLSNKQKKLEVYLGAYTASSIIMTLQGYPCNPEYSKLVNGERTFIWHLRVQILMASDFDVRNALSCMADKYITHTFRYEEQNLYKKRNI